MSVGIELASDVVEDILTRLPVKSLKRLRCLSKYWCSSIESPEFISSHCCFSNNNKVRRILKRDVEFEQSSVFFVSESELELEEEPGFDIPAGLPYHPEEVMSIIIVGCCNGLLSLADSKCESILVWNPATRESKLILLPPIDNIDHVDVHDTSQPPYLLRTIGFGYDPKTNDYKLVRFDSLCCPLIPPPQEFEKKFNRVFQLKRAALYSLTADSWGDLDLGLDYSRVKIAASFLPYPVSTSNGGFCHSWAKVDNQESILSFDFGRQVFTTTPFPDEGSCRLGSIRYINYFFEIEGSMGGVSTHRGSDDCYDVWVLRQVGVKESWTKLFKVGPHFPHLFWPIQSSINDELFCYSCDYYPCRSFLMRLRHNPQSPNELQIARLHPALGYNIKIALAMYAESLVSPLQ